MRDWNAGYATLLESYNAHSSKQKALPKAVLPLHGEFNFPGAPIVRRNLPLNLRNNSAFLFLRPFAPSDLLIRRNHNYVCTGEGVP